MAGKKKGAEASKGALPTVEVTEELFALNKELFEAEGVEVGATIELTKELSESLSFPEGFDLAKQGETKEDAKAEKKGKSVSCPVAILKGDEYVRTYEKGQEEQAAMFLGKNPSYVAVEPEQVASITVQWRENETRKDADTNRMVDTGKLVSKVFVFSLASHGEGFMQEARALANAGVKRSCVVSLVK